MDILFRPRAKLCCDLDRVRVPGELLLVPTVLRRAPRQSGRRPGKNQPMPGDRIGQGCRQKGPSKVNLFERLGIGRSCVRIIREQLIINCSCGARAHPQRLADTRVRRTCTYGALGNTVQPANRGYCCDRATGQPCTRKVRVLFIIISVLSTLYRVRSTGRQRPLWLSGLKSHRLVANVEGQGAWGGGDDGSAVRVYFGRAERSAGEGSDPLPGSYSPAQAARVPAPGVLGRRGGSRASLSTCSDGRCDVVLPRTEYSGACLRGSRSRSRGRGRPACRHPC